MARIADYLKSLSVDKENFRREWIPLHRETCEEPETCPCGKKGIKELCWVQNLVTDESFWVGNCCVRFVAEKGYCAKCEIYPTVSHTAHYCEACARGRKDAPTGIVERGVPRYGPPIKGLTYEDAMFANPSYVTYILKTPSTWKYNDPHFLAYLRLQKERVKAQLSAKGEGVVRRKNG